MSNRVTHFEIQADDIERAKKFYEKTFDWKIEKWVGENMGGMDYWMIMTGPDDTPGINGGMYKRMIDRKIYTYDCTILVDDIDKMIDMVKKNGGTIEEMEKGMEKMEMMGVGWFARGLDPEGNKFGLMQSTTK